MRTRIVLKEKNLPFDRILMDLPNKEQKQDWYLALNPYGKVPVLVEEGAWVYESALCNEYLEEKYPTPSLAPTDAGAKAQMRLWVEFCNSQFVSAVIGLIYENRKPPAERDQEKIDRNKARLNGELFPRLEAQLQSRAYLLGDYSIADIAFTPFLALCERVGVDLSPFPRTAQWAARLKSRDSYEEVKIGLAA
ncbi:MAG TPA: glutathione S-transferase family protein [Candidatus Binatia bacterium]|nr:glutathione S-transferase family protein [Candidatus Binatia bacterium]